jgi:iron complex outermembrane receptor protein
MSYIQKYMPFFAGGALALATVAAQADEQGVFKLGEINVTAAKDSHDRASSYGASVISNAEMFKFSRDTLDQAVTLAPGVSNSNSGGPRNEKLIYIRGFDRFQAPLSIDGIRVYLPVDNRLDFGRFLTGDIAEVQIAKGYVSVLDGPGGIGGAINLVTRKPQKEVEGEMRGGMSFGRNGSYEGASTYLYLGTKQPNYYLQASGNFVQTNGWMLSNSFIPTAVENGGLRDHSDTRDASVSAKAGLTPNGTDEYSLSFVKQLGRKGAPVHVSDPLTASTRYWDWPYWNIQNIYFLSNTAIGESSYVKTRGFYNTFDNALYSYDDINLSRMSTGKAFQSAYHDFAFGGSVEAGTDFGKFDTLKGSFHYRRDQHDGWQANFATTGGCVANVVCMRQPDVVSTEDTFAVALENTIHLTEHLDFVQGVSYNWRHLLKAQDYLSGTGIINYPLKDSSSPDGQAALIWRYANSEKLFANISSRSRYPTLFDRFSSRFGGATSNPGLQPERATNYQIGWAKTFDAKGEVSTAVFYSDVKNFIESVPTTYNGTSVTQSQNVGSGYFVGVEASGSYKLRDDLLVGGNATFLRRHIHNPASSIYQPSGVPFVQGFLYVTWSPLPGLSLTPNVELADSRWTSNTAAGSLPPAAGALYYKTGAYQLLNFQIAYQINPQFTVQAGVRNILDQNYQLVDGFPEAGRSFTLSAKVTF